MIGSVWQSGTWAGAAWTDGVWGDAAEVARLPDVISSATVDLDDADVYAAVLGDERYDSVLAAEHYVVTLD
jgi:hypothetical protein